VSREQLQKDVEAVSALAIDHLALQGMDRLATLEDLVDRAAEVRQREIVAQMHSA
jgi:hypothetical protein